MLATAAEHYRRSALIAKRAVTEAGKVRSGGLPAVAKVLTLHQVAQAQQSDAGVRDMLAEQGYRDASPAALNTLAYTTSSDMLGRMLDSAGNAGFDLLIGSLVQSAGRSAESVASTVRGVSHVRQLTPPSCSRCAVLAGRVYRWSDGFQRHPGCDCTMVPVTSANHGLAADPVDLMRRELVTGMSKADMQAVRDGADFGQVVNVRRSQAGLQSAGHAIARAGRPTPDGIYHMAASQPEAVALLRRFGYIR